MAEITQKGKALDDILALNAQVSKQDSPVNITNYMLNRNPLPGASQPSGNSSGANMSGNQIHILPIDRLVPFKSHPFKLYEGKRLEDMVQSVKANGVLLPIIVRPAGASAYEVLSGHNRIKAAKEAGLYSIPAIVREGLTEDDAMLIVTETNLLQRSFADLSHSERALALATHYDIIKRQGRRTDLINDIENMLKAHDTAISETCTPLGSRLKSADIIGDKYGLSRESVARYIRINKLIDDLKARIDNSEIAVRSGVSLSYLPDSEQEIVEDVLCDGNYKLDMNKADALRDASEKKPLTHETAEAILQSKRKRKPANTGSFKLQPKIMMMYFQPDQKKAEIVKTIETALEFYFAQHPRKGGMPLSAGEYEQIPGSDQAGETEISEIRSV